MCWKFEKENKNEKVSVHWAFLFLCTDRRDDNMMNWSNQTGVYSRLHKTGENLWQIFKVEDTLKLFLQSLRSPRCYDSFIVAKKLANIIQHELPIDPRRDKVIAAELLWTEWSKIGVLLFF